MSIFGNLEGTNKNSFSIGKKSGNYVNLNNNGGILETGTIHNTQLIIDTQSSTPSNPPTGSYKIYPKNDGLFYKLDSFGNESLLSTGSGSVDYETDTNNIKKSGTVSVGTTSKVPRSDHVHPINLLSDFTQSADYRMMTDIEKGNLNLNFLANGNFGNLTTTGWSTYADAAGTVPVDGTGGSPSITFGASSGDQAGYFTPYKNSKLSKPSSNCQGQGISYEFGSTGANLLKNLYKNSYIEVDLLYFGYRNSDYQYAPAGYIGVYLYDISNNMVLTPDVSDLPLSPAQSITKFKCSFDASSLNNFGSSGIRLIFHIKSTNTDAYTFYFGDVCLKIQELSGLTYTPENVANKLASFQETPDDTHYCSEKLVKDSLDGKEPIIGYTPENVSNKVTSFQETPDDTHYPSEKLVIDKINSLPMGTPSFLSNGKFESNITGWSTYADAAGTVPVDGTGGSPNTTFSRNTTNPLFETADGLLTKNAANRQGEGVSTDFTLDLGILSSLVQVEFFYKTSSNYVGGDIGIYIYDVTNDQIIYPNVISLPSSGVSTASKFLCKFFPNTNSTSYRLIFHISTTNANGYTVNIDNVKICEEEKIVGVPISDWNDFPSVAVGTLITATTTNPTYGTVVTNKAKWRRVGDSMEIFWQHSESTSGSSGSGTYLFNLPSGYQIDSSKINIGVGTVDKLYPVSGVFTAATSGTFLSANLFSYDSTRLYAFGTDQNAEYIWSSSGYPFGDSSVPHHWTLHAIIPIAGWSSNINLIQNSTEYAANSQASVNTNDTTSFLQDAPNGTPILSNTVATYYDVQFKTVIQPNDNIQLEFRNIVSGLWVSIEKAVWYTGSIFRGLQSSNNQKGSQPTGAGFWILDNKKVRVAFNQYCTYDDVSGNRGWSGLISDTTYGFDKWRVRKSAGVNVAELPPGGNNYTQIKTTNYTFALHDSIIIADPNVDQFGVLNVYLPVGSNAYIGKPLKVIHGSHAGIVKINCQGSDKINTHGVQVASLKLYNAGEQIEVIWNGTDYTVRGSTNVKTWQSRSDWSNAHCGNGFTYDTKSAGIDLTGMVLTEATSGNTALCIYDSGGTGTSGILYFTNMTGTMLWTNDRTVTASNGTTCLVNESTSSKDKDYSFYHGMGINNYIIHSWYNTTADFNTRKMIPSWNWGDAGNLNGYGIIGIDENSYKYQTARDMIIPTADDGSTSPSAVDGFIFQQTDFNF